MSAITQFASSLWQTTTAGVANIGAGAAMAAVSSAMFDFSQRFPTPRKRWHHFVITPLYALPLLAMILSFVPEQGKAPSNFVHHGASVYSRSGSQPIRHRHGQYYRVLVYFAAGDTLFNEVVPSGFFPDGAVKQDVPGMTEDNPIVMPPDVTAVDLENMFKVLKIGPSGRRFEGNHSRSTWESILKLSVHPPFNEWKLRELAIAEIEDTFVKDSTAMVDRLLLGQRFGITQWVVCASEKLSRRDEPLTKGEKERLGCKTSLRLSDINIQSRRWSEGSPQRDRSMFNFWDAVLEEFEDELSEDKAYTSWSEYPCASIVVD